MINKSPYFSSLTSRHAEHLTDMVKGGLMRKVLPHDVEEHFLKHGYIQKATGGMMATDAGQYALMLWQKETGN